MPTRVGGRKAVGVRTQFYVLASGRDPSVGGDEVGVQGDIGNGVENRTEIW